MVRRRPGRLGPGLPAGLLIACGLADLAAVDLDQGAQVRVEDAVIEAPNPGFEAGTGVVSYHDGFLLRLDDKLVVGEALRWDRNSDEFFATGHPVLVMDGMRLEARDIGIRRLGRNPQGQAVDEDGTLLGRLPVVVEAWHVEVEWAQPEGEEDEIERLRAELEGRKPQPPKPRGWRRIRAERVEILPDRIVFHGAEADGGHGGMLSVGSRKIVLGLHDAANKEREGLARDLEDITVWSPTIRLLDVPVMWAPALYRDFRLDYPWTYFEAGRNDRLGYYARGWIGSDLPPVLDLATRLELRADEHWRSGTGFGAEFDWEHPWIGRGRWLWYGMPHEVVRKHRGFENAVLEGPVTAGRVLSSRSYTASGERPPVINRDANVIDIEHRWGFGPVSLYGRWVDIPDADPITPDILDPNLLFATPERRSPSERFRNDYLRQELEHLPLARRGIEAAWTNPWFSAVIDTTHKHHQDLTQTDRLFGAQVTIPRLKLIGPLHIEGEGWYEILERNAPERRWLHDQVIEFSGQKTVGRWPEARAERLTYQTALSVGQWLAGIGFDGRTGIEGLYHQDGRFDLWQRTWPDLEEEDLLTGNPGWNLWYDRAYAGTLPQRDFGTERVVYDEGNGTYAVDGQHRWVPFADAGLKTRVEGFWGRDRDYRHVVTPRIGFEFRGKQRGPLDVDWEPFDFQDGRDRLENDQRFLVTGLDTTFGPRRGRTTFSAEVDFRWGLRNEDRRYTRRLNAVEKIWQDFADDEVEKRMRAPLSRAMAEAGWPTPARVIAANQVKEDRIDPYLSDLHTYFAEVTNSSALVEIDGGVKFVPGYWGTFLSADFTYDARKDVMKDLTLSFRISPVANISFNYTALWLPETFRVDEDLLNLNIAVGNLELEDEIAIDPLVEIGENWQHRLELTLKANRYEFTNELEFKKGGNILDTWRVKATRRLVDGEMSFGFEFVRDEFGNVADERWTFGVTLYGLDFQP